MTITELKAPTDLEQRLRRLEDAEEIRQLKALYGGYWDAGWSGAHSNGEKLAELFTEDGVWDGSPLSPVLNGRSEIRDYCEWLGRYVSYDEFGERRELESVSLHMACNPVITVEGDTASATFIGLLASPHPDIRRAVWCAGRYIDDLVRTPEGWKFQRVNFEYAFFTPFDGPGWVAERFVDFAQARGAES
jgi:SnoaL-like domain